MSIRFRCRDQTIFDHTSIAVDCTDYLARIRSDAAAEVAL
jgi:hypothetical protein